MSNAVAIIEEDSPSPMPSPLAERRFEYLYGAEYAMFSPNAVHQVIVLNLASQLFNFFKGKPGIPFTGPFDVYPLADQGDVKTFVEPDLFVLCDRERLKLEGYYGAPPFVIEILSKDRSHDLVTKLNLYYQSGVAEYLVIDPEQRIVMAFTLGEGAYRCQSYFFAPRIPVHFFPDLVLDLSFDLPF